MCICPLACLLACLVDRIASPVRSLVRSSINSLSPLPACLPACLLRCLLDSCFLSAQYSPFSSFAEPSIRVHVDGSHPVALYLSFEASDSISLSILLLSCPLFAFSGPGTLHSGTSYDNTQQDRIHTYLTIATRSWFISKSVTPELSSLVRLSVSVLTYLANAH
ncbi:hypothetical protein GGS21DRAFT_534702 [Xylaria nigripes]|nr:hypothetical protein GGS21DRAFT_534702 [Xylaria nigripes]